MRAGPGSAPTPSRTFSQIVTRPTRNCNTKAAGWACGFPLVTKPQRLSTVIIRNSKSLALALGLLATLLAARAQEAGALIDALIRKGILTNQEAEDIRAEIVRDSNTVPAHVFAGNKSTDRLSVGMRLHLQYANLGTEIRDAAFQPPATEHLFFRRMYLTLKAGLGAQWGAIVTFDFTGQSYDDANIEWTPNNDLTFAFGLRKVDVCYEERASSGNIKAIERSSVTRYFVESNNGRRLGAGSYRIGVFLNGKRDLSEKLALIYSADVTEPERNETWSGSAGFGDSTNNQLALWGTVGLHGKLARGTWAAAVGTGWMPDQGGFGTVNLGRGYDLNVYSVSTDITAGAFGLMAEFLAADVERGRGTPGNADAWPRGFFVQPSLLLTDTIEAVVRYAWLDSDGRGVTLADVIRSAPAGGTMNKFTEWYAGVNWYLKGNDLKYQLGGVYGKTRDALSGGPEEAKAVGVRSQLQMQF